MKDVIAFLVKFAPFLTELYELHKTNEQEALKRIDARVQAEREAWAKKYGKKP